MITRSARPTSNFYLLDKAISENKRLGWAARGMLVFLLGKPDRWTVSPAALVNETAQAGRSTGRDGVYAALKELKDAGYLRSVGNRSDGGTFAGADYIVYESPQTENPDTVDSPDTANPDAVAPVAPHTGLPDTANPTQVSIDSKQGLNREKGLNIPAAPSALPTDIADKATKPAKPKVTPEESELQAACKATWLAYADAYCARYGIEPTRNAKVNSNVKEFVKRIGHDESPGVARFYVDRVNETFVIRGYHALGTLLQNAEAYRTQWATGQTMTTTRAKQIDQSQANFSVVGEAMAIRRAKQEAQHAQ